MAGKVPKSIFQLSNDGLRTDLSLSVACLDSPSRITLHLLTSFFLALLTVTTTAAETWRGLTVAPENRCSPCSARNYRYPSSVEPRIVAKQGGKIYGPYTGRYFKSISETDIEHIVARSEAHDSGLCAAKRRTRRRFARDLLNLTLASPSLNRHQKSDRDAAEWMPEKNRCWFAARVVAVRRKYELTIDRREADAVGLWLNMCQHHILLDVY